MQLMVHLHLLQPICIRLQAKKKEKQQIQYTRQTPSVLKGQNRPTYYIKLSWSASGRINLGLSIFGLLDQALWPLDEKLTMLASGGAPLLCMI